MGLDHFQRGPLEERRPEVMPRKRHITLTGAEREMALKEQGSSDPMRCMQTALPRSVPREYRRSEEDRPPWV